MNETKTMPKEMQNTDKQMRKNLLLEVEKLICQDREKQYGTPENSFNVICEFWNVYLKNKKDNMLEPKDIGAMMCLLKLARMLTGQQKIDNILDAAGYLIISGSMYDGLDSMYGE